MDLIDIYRAFHLKAAEYTFFICMENISQVDQMLGYKVSFSIFKKTEIISSILFNHNAGYKEKTAKITNTWWPNNMVLNNQWITEEIKEEIKKYQEMHENENIMIQNFWDIAIAILREKLTAKQAHLKKLEKSQPL